MARKRLVSPNFFRHAELMDAEAGSGLPLRLAYIALWCQCDRRGYFAWRPRELKLVCLPWDAVDFAAVLDALETFGFIETYWAGGKRYGRVPTLGKHQTFHVNEKPDPNIPEPEDDDDTSAAPCRHGAGPVPVSGGAGVARTVTVAGTGAVAVSGTTTGPGASAEGSDQNPTGHPIADHIADATEPRPTGRPPVKIGPAFLPMYDRLAAAALPHERAALDVVLAAANMPDLALGSMHAIAIADHRVVSDAGIVADVRHVLIAITEAAAKFFADGRPYDQALFRGCVRRVVNRRPEPTSKDERAAADALLAASPSLVVLEPRTPDELAAAETRRRAAMAEFYRLSSAPDVTPPARLTLSQVAR